MRAGLPRRWWREVLRHPAWSAPFCNRQALLGDDDFRSLGRLSRAPLCPPGARRPALVGGQPAVMVGVHPVETPFGGAARTLDVVVAGDVAASLPSRWSRCWRRGRPLDRRRTPDPSHKDPYNDAP